jgi:hypothetical protein
VSDYYILDDDNNVVEAGVMEWGEWWEANSRAGGRRFLARTALEKVWVSTVFLGADHGLGDGPPLIFESMVFPLDSVADLDGKRYSTYAEALHGHAALVRKWRKKQFR